MEEQKPKRGCFLTGMLWLILVATSIFTCLMIIGMVKFINQNGMNGPIGLIGLGIALNILIIIGIILILYWKKQGCYLIAIVGAINFVENFIVNKTELYFAIGVIIRFAIILLIAYFSYKAIEKREKFMQEEA